MPIAHGLNILVAGQIIVNSRKIFVPVTLADCETVDLFRNVGQGQCSASFLATDRGEVQIFLKLPRREVSVAIVTVLDSIAFSRQEWCGRRSAEHRFK